MASPSRRAAIERVLRSLPLLPAEMERVQPLADQLEILAAAGPAPAPPRLRPGSAATVAKQLRELLRLSSSLADKLERGGGSARCRERLRNLLRELTSDTIQSIDKAIQAQSSAVNLAFMLNDLPKYLGAGDRPYGMTPPDDVKAAQLLRQIAEIAASAAPIGTPAGRPRDHYFMVVARIAARQYQILTGKEPTFSHGPRRADQDAVHGPFVDFGRELFAVMGIRRDALTYISQAAYELRGAGRKK